ncbi:MAG: hypothetical protein ACRCVV_14580 [Shewanella sp.]|uniref:hypothetical protein n=1 Tax=Aeromonas popoffii TaxID=70856 RepID=UPI003F33D7A1
MIDLFIRADSESDMISALDFAGFICGDEITRPYHQDAELDIIGTIYQPTGEVIMAGGEEVPVMSAVPGYHVNVRTTSQEVADKLESLRTYPVTPVRVWA